jgi:RNA recognition motif-containing protein
VRRDIEKLFVNNLPKGAEEQKLKDLFSKYGQVMSVVIPQTVSKRRAGYAIVEMENYRAAQQAIEFLSGSDLDGQRITVTPALTQDEFRRPS